jgi:hypothetical protein
VVNNRKLFEKKGGAEQGGLQSALQRGFSSSSMAAPVENETHRNDIE